MTTPTLTLDTTALLAGVSKRTLWRRVQEGKLSLAEHAPGRPARVGLAEAQRVSGVALPAEEQALLLAADAGDAAAGTELGLWFLAHGDVARGVAWLTRAADALEPEALYQLGRCHLAGVSVAADAATGKRLIAQAAGLGHRCAEAVLPLFHRPEAASWSPTEWDAALDAAEQQLIAEVVATLSS